MSREQVLLAAQFYFENCSATYGVDGGYFCKILFKNSAIFK
jgi:hypothetical protein